MCRLTQTAVGNDSCVAPKKPRNDPTPVICRVLVAIGTVLVGGAVAATNRRQRVPTPS